MCRTRRTQLSVDTAACRAMPLVWRLWATMPTWGTAGEGCGLSTCPIHRVQLRSGSVVHRVSPGAWLLLDYAYVAAFNAGLRVIDVSDPQNPQERGFRDTSGNAVGVAVSGSYAYVAEGDPGLRVIDVSNPQVPVQVGEYNTPYFAQGVAVAGDFAFVADRIRGLRIVDISDPQRPSEVGYYDTTGYADGVALAGNYIYVANGDAGLQIIQFYGAGIAERTTDDGRRHEGGATVVRGVLYVGPATRSELPGRNSVMSRAELLNATGRKVMELQAGPNDVRQLAPGVYFVRDARAPAQAQAQAVKKVIITK